MLCLKWREVLARRLSPCVWLTTVLGVKRVSLRNRRCAVLAICELRLFTMLVIVSGLCVLVTIRKLGLSLILCLLSSATCLRVLVTCMMMFLLT